MAGSNKPGEILAVIADTDTVLRVSVRPGWHQRTRMELGDPALEARMHAMAELGLQQFDSAWEVLVWATRGDQTRVYRLERYRGHWSAP